jgi:hypothetical protein
MNISSSAVKCAFTGIATGSDRDRLLKSAPEQGAGLNRWILTGALMTKHLSPEKAHGLIMEVIVERGGAGDSNDSRAVEKAIRKASNSTFTAGTSARQWPEPNMQLIEELTLLRAWDVPGALATLEGKSPDSLKRRTAAELVRRLFGPDAYIAPGFFPDCTGVTRTTNEHLSKMAFLVPNPMKGLTGRTQEGKDSGRCLDNVKVRRFLVVEFDFKPVTRAGEPSKWSQIVRTWQDHGMTALDAQAALILFLIGQGPLVMVTFSGSSSLHSWWFCEGEPEHEGSRLNRFMRNAALLGADTALFTASQFARMPLGTRKTGEQQTIHYLNFGTLNKE